MNQDEIKQRVRGVVANALKVDPASIQDNTSQMNLSDWDSVRHMNVILALENEFDIQFEDNELPKLTSLPVIVTVVERHIGMK